MGFFPRLGKSEVGENILDALREGRLKTDADRYFNNIFILFVQHFKVRESA